jgi:two-component system NtrC family sensor kinase
MPLDRVRREDLQRLEAAHAAALQALHAAIRDSTRLTRLFTILSEHAPLDALLDKVLSTLSELFSSDVAALLRRSGEGAFVPLRAIGLPEEVLDRPLSGSPDSYVAAAIETRAPAVAADALNDPRVDPHLRALEIETAAFLPVMGNDGVRAVMILARCRRDPYAPADLDLLMAMGYRIGLAMERARSEALLHEAQDRLLQTEKLALAGKLAGSVAHEVNNPLACVRANLEVLQRHLPTIEATFRAARAAAEFLAAAPDPSGPPLARALVAAMEPEGRAVDVAGELGEIAADSMEAVRRIGHLVSSFVRLSTADRPAEPVSHDVRVTIAECVADLPPDTGRPPLVREPGDGRPCIAWIAPPVLRAAVTGLLRFLLAPGLRRAEPNRPVAIRAERSGRRPVIVISDPALVLSSEERRSIFDPRMEVVETPKGRTVRLSLVATLSYQLLRGCGAEISTSTDDPHGLEIRILLPAAPIDSRT